MIIPEFFTEVNALSYFKDDMICKIYDYDKEYGAILLERIIPGDNLLTANKDKWLEIAADISYKLPVEIEDKGLFPDYKDWINKAFNRAKKENKMDKDMLNLIDKAENKFSESKLIVSQNLFILLVLSTCWSYENHSPKAKSLKHREDKCRFVNKYMEDKLL